MKLIKNICSCIVILFSLTGVSFAQQHPILGSFTTDVYEEDVILSWVILSGSTCNGIRIYRSANNSEFEQISEIYGICGNINFPEKYTFKDENPIKNAHNNYKLELGIEGFSQVVSAEVIDIETGNQVRPNPADERTRIYFDNNNSSEHTLLVLMPQVERFCRLPANKISLMLNFHPFNLASTIFPFLYRAIRFQQAASW